MTEAPVIQLSIDYRVRRYKVFKKLEDGEFGAVYAVRDDAGEEHVLKAQLNTKEIYSLRIELCVMTKVSEKSPSHMPTLIDKGRHDNFNYIVMKLLGKSLQDAIKTGPDGHLTFGLCDWGIVSMLGSIGRFALEWVLGQRCEPWQLLSRKSKPRRASQHFCS
ncbi:Protein kinase domain-containing protein [Caenorhabditis elegans]|uniref:Protein kinase domain-containing protein n=1 Tax=Caenorhabditis elegans TaxID=6239 RepID=Q18055_CAEEL|nr:Protein kinase domain-containing protein [Caenorhabditis elegans]CCD64842.1 Protein kinase domain-containing protein [Caenorhabditis elegans]|eukprot:NP_495064.2 Uncharacterized protein CELE_C17C3.11 [Caenorhabditis elegans]